MKSEKAEKILLVVLIGVFIILLPCIGQAEIPGKINYQGYLKEWGQKNGVRSILLT